MSNSKLFSLVAMPTLLLLLTTAPDVRAAPNSDSLVIAAADSMNVSPDNSATNERDRTAQEPTADQGGNQMNDRDIMQKIRKDVIADKSLSAYAQNVKIISQNGKVTLKGPVQSDPEKHNIDAKATNIAGDGNVIDELSVMPAK
jgi:osmotically-inducible protein OsmY